MLELWRHNFMPTVTIMMIINVKNEVTKNCYRRRSYMSKRVPVAFYWARSDETVPYKSNETLNFWLF